MPRSQEIKCLSQKSSQESTNMWENATQQNTKPPPPLPKKRQLYKRLRKHFLIFLLSGMDCWCESAENWHNCEVQQTNGLNGVPSLSQGETCDGKLKVSPSQAAPSQVGGPRRRLSSWAGVSSRSWTCSAPALWAVSMAVVSRWAHLIELSSVQRLRHLWFYLVPRLLKLQTVTHRNKTLFPLTLCYLNHTDL